MSWWLVLIPIISAFIGWILNWVAIKMLFHPREPKKILGITIQGILPKRQKQFATKIGKLVSTELLSFDAIEQKITSPTNVEKIMPILEVHIDTFLREKLTAQIPMLGMLIGDKTIGHVKAVFLKELEELFPTMMQQYMSTLKNDLDLEKTIAGKVSDFSLIKLEESLNQNMSKELKFVKMYGAGLGFIIGIIQVLITIAAR